jgi:hypothetical protein
MQRTQFIKLFVQAIIAFSLLLNPANGQTAAIGNSAHPKIYTEWVANQVVEKHNQKVKAQRTLEQKQGKIPLSINVTVQLKLALQQTWAFSKPRTQHQKVPSEDELIA